MDLLDIKTWTTYFAQTSVEFKQAIFGYVPHLIGALVVLLIGLLLAKIFKYVGTKIGQLIFKFLNAIEKKYHIGNHGSHRGRKNYAALLGHLFYWVILIYFIFFALRVLNIPGVKAWIADFTRFIPNLVGALAIVYIGFLLGALAKNLVSPEDSKSQEEDHYFLAQALRFGIITVFIIWGVGQIGFNVNILTSFINIILASIFGAAAIGFGLGSSKHVANMIAAFNFKKSFQVGDKLAIEQHQGVIVDITNNAIILETSEGIVVIPAQKVLDNVCKKGG